MEIIDSRYRDFKFDFKSVIADNTSSWRFVIGGRPRDVDELHLRTLGVVLEKNGETMTMGAGAAVLGNPLTAVAMMADQLASRGQVILAGTSIMTGGVTEAIRVEAGDNVVVRFQDLGTVSMRFAWGQALWKSRPPSKRPCQEFAPRVAFVRRSAIVTSPAAQ